MLEYLVKMTAVCALPGESLHNLYLRVDEFASAVENDGANGWRPIALKFLDALPSYIYVAVKKQWEDGEQRQEFANPPLPTINIAEIRVMAMG